MHLCFSSLEAPGSCRGGCSRPSGVAVSTQGCSSLLLVPGAAQGWEAQGAACHPVRLVSVCIYTAGIEA